MTLCECLQYNVYDINEMNLNVCYISSANACNINNVYDINEMNLNVLYLKKGGNRAKIIPGKKSKSSCN
ncbi:hypothetical protein HMPREF1705_04719 [Acetomicrobium hydrogeniformans ATCC BAA-1850]|uniref:Uncharacterized protein n=1 Tax=Acetomicrobium hydrogeniformans ATCC BAA-1850 TaxID=592015 RepID=A0A0T5XDL3_9BACT|nr:hypothetical protein HMPREF1705_04719 [Acetomicrobium hydrogeniformans ATCC BAA-1850]